MTIALNKPHPLPKIAAGNSAIQVTRFSYAGLFTVTLATLLFENLLTRIFSVTMWYHFAFMAVSIALFGMTAGAILVYLLPNLFTGGRIKQGLSIGSLLFAVTTLASIWIHLQLEPQGNQAGGGAAYLAITYGTIAVPFVFSGAVVSLALTKLSGPVGRLYAADLIGAAFGCLLFVGMLQLVSALTGVMVIAVLACLAAVIFAQDTNRLRLRSVAVGAALVVLVLTGGQVALERFEISPLRLRWVKGQSEPPLLVEKWNSYSRVRVIGDPETPGEPFGSGFSLHNPNGYTARQLYMDIDSSAATVLTHFDGDLSKVGYLKQDMANLAHYLRPNANVLVIGAGGGRDVLSALVFQQNKVTGVEINENILDIDNQVFGEFTGHLDRQPGVVFANDEARSYISRSPEQYDIILSSLIDTWAATAAGAYVFTENSLYTLEGWKVFLDHLTSNGILTFSRWYYADMPGEMYRLTALASRALMNEGIPNPRDHIVIVRIKPDSAGETNPNGVGTLLASKGAFTPEDLDAIRQNAEKMGYEIILSPEDGSDPAFISLATPEDHSGFISSYPLNIDPPTDDKPFFFHMVRFEDLLNLSPRNQGFNSMNIVAEYTLWALFITVTGLTFLCIVVPLLLTSRRVDFRILPPYLLYFIGIGLGYMLVEISQIQRLTVFLGHPTYSLTTALFSLLLASSLGSAFTQRVDLQDLRRSWAAWFAALLIMLVLFGVVTPALIREFAGSPNPVRILIAVTILFPIGFFMGMAFPLGMKAAAGKASVMTPWLWGINGAASVCGSVIAITIALNKGISAAFWSGFASYGLAFLAVVWVIRRPR